MNKRKFLTILLVVLTSLSMSLFAQGAIEKGENEKLIQVVSLNKTDDGTYDIIGLLENGTNIIYHVAPDVDMEFPIESITEGMYLYVKDNGIMTMSLPPQSPAIGIRNVTMAVLSGAIDTEFAPAQNIVLNISDVDLDDMFSRFSYSYGYMTTENYMLNGIYFNAGYYAKGIFDAWGYGEIDPYFSVEEMYGYVEEFVNLYQNESGMEAEVGAVYSTEEELNALAAPTTLEEQFSYSYGYLLAMDLLFQGYDLVAPDFASGALYALYDVEPLMTDIEMEEALDEYNSYLSGLYEEFVSQLASENLAEANAFLEENANAEGVITLDSGVQLKFETQSESTEQPQDTDSVVLDYTLTLLDGTVMDEGEDVTFSLDSLIPGFTEAVLNMHVGDSVIAYIPPEFGYGENGAGNIEPNSLLIFTIHLDSIVVE